MTGQLSHEELAAQLAGLRATLVLLYTDMYGRDPHPHYLEKNHEATQALVDMLREVRRRWERNCST